MQTKVNWFGLAGGIAIFVLIDVSLFSPWWILTVGQGLVKANVSPIYTNFDFVGTKFTVPLLWALNVASILTMASGGAAMLIYSVKPNKKYSNRLLRFGYAKPLISVILFICVLFALQQIIKMVVSLNVPIFGTATSIIPPSRTYGAVVTVLMSAEFQWPFYLAITAATLCIAARFYHKKIIPPLSPMPTPATIATTTMTKAESTQ